jgi:hypothetical protein
MSLPTNLTCSTYATSVGKFPGLPMACEWEVLTIVSFRLYEPALTRQLWYFLSIAARHCAASV